VRIRPQPPHCNSSRTVRDLPTHHCPACRCSAQLLLLLLLPDPRLLRPCRASAPSVYACAACVLGLRRPYAAAALLLLARRHARSQLHLRLRAIARSSRLSRAPAPAPCARAPAPPAPPGAAPSRPARPLLRPLASAPARAHAHRLPPALRSCARRATPRAARARASTAPSRRCRRLEPRRGREAGGGPPDRGATRGRRGHQVEEEQREGKNKGEGEKGFPKDLCANLENCRVLSVKHKFHINLKP
jgi:hypothetical protein